MIFSWLCKLQFLDEVIEVCLEKSMKILLGYYFYEMYFIRKFNIELQFQV